MLFFFSFIFSFFNASLPPFHFFRICFYVSVLTWPWNLEFGSPPSTLSCHLSLKNEYEYEEKYTAASIQGSQTVLQEEEVGDKGRRRHSLRWFQGHCASGAPWESGRGSWVLDVRSSCREGAVVPGLCPEEGATPVPLSCPLRAAKASATEGPPAAPAGCLGSFTGRCIAACKTA